MCISCISNIIGSSQNLWRGCWVGKISKTKYKRHFWPWPQNPRYKRRKMNTLIWFIGLKWCVFFIIWFLFKWLLSKTSRSKICMPPQPCSFSVKEVTMLWRISHSIFLQKTDLGYSSIWTFTCQVCKCFGSLKGKVPGAPGKPGTWSFLLPCCFTSHWHGAQGGAQKKRKQTHYLRI